jgi:hypothetical protein
MEYIGFNLKNSDCVIVGICNALKWLKKKPKYSKVEDIARNYFEYDIDNGFYTKSIQDFMKFWEIPYESMENAPIGEVESEILKGKAALAIIKRKNEDKWHMTFLKPKENRGIELVNCNSDWIELVQDFCKKEISLSIWTIGNAA